VIADLVDLAKTHAVSPAALTFHPHPLEVVAPERAPKLLSTVEQRIDSLKAAGAEIVGVLPFPVIRHMDPMTFAVDVLGKRLNARAVVVGSDFRFGLDRAGDLKTLRIAGAQMGYEVEAVDLVDDYGHGPISSTTIRALLEEGDVVGAADLLGHRYEVCGIVVEGDKRGRTIGFPTANLGVDERVLIPADGVYTAWATVHEQRHPAVVNIGVRPTFANATRTIEAHLLGFSGDLYGQSLALGFVGRLRGEQRFGSVDELVAQIGRDVAAARSDLDLP
jgi:riboflavin kinase/FMN adenylyltransferase